MSGRPRDYFEVARAWASTGLVIAGALLVAGSFLDWVKVETLPRTVPADQARFADPFNGFDVTDGYVIAGAGIVLIFCATMIMLKANSAHGWLAFFAAMVAGAIGISDYRDISGLFEQFGGIGRGISPGIGITIVAGAALLGIVSAVAAVAASPKRN